MKLKHWILALSAAGLVACSDGPAEDAGEEIDEAVEEMTGDDSGPMEEVGEAMDDMADDVTDAAEDIEEAVEDATDEPH
ncbi:hypothetical protein [Maricaulis parjimensis]|uniref:hypothetical protein n=1 Tax=Maricaulis parjimensis TaxID=144023 RepID=UPI00193A547E|nr:hypothetical protein [Maricaulis parjimensis]